MAKSPAHKFGQEIGLLLEEIIKPLLHNFSAKRNYYLDSKGPRGKARTGKKVSWLDKYGNSHDLDFVIEKGGSPATRGRPLAFIESAWRRYTKHARNKAQEIQGAILPIVEKHPWDAPFLGVIIGGVFTEGAISQMQSSGFTVLYISRETIIAAFQHAGIAIDFDESTPDRDFKRCLRALNALTQAQRGTLKDKLVQLNSAKIESFMATLDAALKRYVESILITPLFGAPREFQATDAALVFLNDASNFQPEIGHPLHGIDIRIRFSNGDKIECTFQQIDEVRNFLNYVTG
jgi:hypothetical protein